MHVPSVVFQQVLQGRSTAGHNPIGVATDCVAVARGARDLRRQRIRIRARRHVERLLIHFRRTYPEALEFPQ